MLNNILNGYRPLITKIGVISLLAFCITFALTPTQATEDKSAPPNPIFDLPATLKCGPTKIFIDEVKGKAEEELVAYGQSDDSNQYVISIWTNFKTKSWTVALMDVRVPAITCIMHTGNNFNFKVPDVKGKYST